MSREIRIAPGDITAYALLDNDNYLVTSWPLQTGQTTFWRASQPDKGEMRRQMRPSLSRGSGKWVGLWAGVIEFWTLDGSMREYINETIMVNKPIATVTAYLHATEFEHLQIFTGELVTPHAANSENEYQRFDDVLYHGNRYILRRATRKQITVLAATSGHALLATSNEALAVEQQS